MHWERREESINQVWANKNRSENSRGENIINGIQFLCLLFSFGCIFEYFPMSKRWKRKPRHVLNALEYMSHFSIYTAKKSIVLLSIGLKWINSNLIISCRKGYICHTVFNNHFKKIKCKATYKFYIFKLMCYLGLYISDLEVVLDK
jgi:hypothetical protein